MTLENKLKSAKSYLKNSLIGGIALASSAFGSEALKMNARDGEWNYSLTPISNSSSMSGGVASSKLLKKGEIDTKINLHGRVKDDYLEISYIIENPSPDGFYFNNIETRVFAYVPEGTTFEDKERKSIVAYNGKKAISDKLVPKDSAKSLTARIGKGMLENLEQKDFTKKYISSMTAGLVDDGIISEFIKFTNTKYGRPKNNVDGIDVIEIGQGTYDGNSMSIREIARKIKVMFRKDETEIPISLYFKFQVQKSADSSDERGVVEACTTPFTIKSIQKANRLGDLELWMSPKEEEGLIIYKDRMLRLELQNIDTAIKLEKEPSGKYTVSADGERQEFNLDKEKDTILWKHPKYGDVLFYTPKDFFSKFYGKISEQNSSAKFTEEGIAYAEAAPREEWEKKEEPKQNTGMNNRDRAIQLNKDLDNMGKNLERTMNNIGRTLDRLFK